MASKTIHGLQINGHHEQHCSIGLASLTRTKRDYSGLLPCDFDTGKKEAHYNPAFAL